MLFVIPPLCCLAGCTLAFVFSWTYQRWKSVAGVLGAVVCVALSLHVYTMILLHPNQYVYFNRFIGGLQGARGKYAIDYWGNSVKEAVEGLMRYLKEKDGEAFKTKQYRISLFYKDYFSGEYFFPPNFILVRNSFDADYGIVAPDLFDDREVVFAVTRLGVPLKKVIKMDRQLGR